jgi:Fe-S cluster assembly scaffold protein SufB
MAATDIDRQALDSVKSDYKYGWSQPEQYVFKARKGLDHEIVEQISRMKGEPDWMRQLRHEALDIFFARPIPTWGPDLSAIDYQDIYYYIKPVEAQGRSWDDVPADIKETFDKLGIPEAERKFLAGAGAQYESEVVYHSLRQEWERQGVIFTDSDGGLREHPNIYREYFGTVVPATDNTYAALNTACWSGGSFVYVPKGVHLDIPLQAYFRINAQSMGQFERTLIIVDEGASVHYVEGCTAPVYSTDSLHSGVIEIIVRKNARCRYTTIQNWSTNVYNLVTQRSLVYEGGTMEWVDANLGCLEQGSTVTTPEGIKPIEELEAGERVLSYDESTGQLCFRRVLAKRFSGHQLVHTVTAGERKLRVTANHPFYSYTCDAEMPKKLGRYRLGYVRADQLKEAIVPRASLDYGKPHRTIGRPNIELPDAVQLVEVEVSEPSSQAVPTWDIEVEGTGNFVSQGFIVHNSKVTMKYPSVYMLGEGAHGQILSMAFAGPGQHLDTGGKLVHAAPNCSSQLISKSISKGGGRASYRGLLKVGKGAVGARSNVVCDALLLDEQSRSDTYPYIEIDEDDVTVGHEASVSKIGEEQLFYLQSRGLSEDEASAMIVSGFIEPMVKELPMEYAVEMNRLIQLQMEGSIG